jgi:DUF4097 and DUF4098 domain-containing protein YvlB
MTTFQRTIKYCAVAFAIFLTVIIVGGIVNAVQAFLSCTSGGITGNTMKKVDFSKEFTNVDSLDIDISYGSLIIAKGTAFKVEAENVTDDFKAKVSGGGKLSILQEGKASHFWGFHFGTRQKNEKSKITVYIPEDFTAHDTKIDTGAGKMTIEQLHTKKLFISSGAGEIEGDNITAEEANIDGGVGAIHLTNASLKDTDLKCGVGSLKMEGALLGESNVECGVGEVDLNLKGNKKDYELNVDSGMGATYVNGTRIKHDYKTDYEAANSIDIDGGVGEVNVKFTQEN